jgi:hypothetical protein
VAINKIDIKRIAIGKAERNSPIAADRQRPEAGVVPAELVNAQTWGSPHCRGGTGLAECALPDLASVRLHRPVRADDEALDGGSS